MTEAPYDPWLRDIALKSSHPFIRDSEAMIRYLLELNSKTPPRYGWRMISPEAFDAQIASVIARVSETNDAVKAIEDIKRLYWHDMARNIEVYGVTVLWRATELIRSSIRSLNARDVLAPAVLSRCLLELATTVIVNSNTVWKTVEELPSDVQGALIANPELEQFVVRMIWGTRLGKPPKHLEQEGVGKSIGLLSKHPNASELKPTYDYLCEVAHPNVIGNARFWAKVEARNEDGSETLSVEPAAESLTTREIREKTLWALGWSAACVRNGFEISQNTVSQILKRWPKLRSER